MPEESKKLNWFERHRAASLVLVLMIVLAMIAMASGGNSTYTSAPASSESSSQTPSSTPAPKPINLSGTGQAATDKFELKQGLATAKLTNTGDGHFDVWLMDKNGEKLELLANDSGQPFNGSKAFKVPSTDQYLLNIAADSGASWTVEITQ